MPASEFATFDTAALAAAIDARRRERGMTWRRVADEAGVSASTMTRAARGGHMEADGVMFMVGWLRLHPEAFLRVPGDVAVPDGSDALAQTTGASGEAFPTYARVDSVALFAALDARRSARGLTWREAAAEVGLTASTLINMGKRPSPRDTARRDLDPRTGIYAFMAMVQWIGVPAASFVRSSRVEAAVG